MTLAEEIQGFIARGEGANEDQFNRLAQKLFAYQYEHNGPYHTFCQGRGVTPERIVTWRDIPAAPAAAFKSFLLTCAPEADCTPEYGGRTFHSSGTTGRDTSRHYMDAAALDCYRVSLREGYRQFTGWAAQRTPYAERGLLPIAAVMPTPEEAPHSSLSFMLGELVSELGLQFFHGSEWMDGLAKEFRCTPYPYTVFGTAFAFVQFFDAVEEPFTLPEGSIIIETGGFKGRSREISREELYSLFTERLGVPPEYCLSEYGMSEMASQFYSIGDSPKRGPHWVRTRIMDPITGREATPGQPGLLAHCDLANLNSVLALQTEDMGIANENGFTLLGRAPGAILRGCSLTAEELMGPIPK